MFFPMLVLLQAGAPTVPAPAPTMVAAAPAKPAKPKLICRTSETLGSRLGGQRTCMTAADWDQRAREDRGRVERMQSNNARAGGG